MLNKKGFTLVELLAVIVVMGAIMTLGTIAVLNVLGNAKAKTREEIEKNLIEAASAYALSKDYYFEPCKKTDVLTCAGKTIKVSDLIGNFFEDNANHCKRDGEIFIYMNETYEYRTFFKTENICEK